MPHATFCQNLSPNSVLLTLETIRGKHPDTPQRYVYLGERQFLVSTSVRSARYYSFTIKMKDFSLHFNVSLQKLD